MENKSDRVRKIKSFLIFGPYLLIFLLAVLCVVLLCVTVGQGRRISELSDRMDEEAESEDSVLNKVSDLEASNNKLTKSLDDVAQEIAELKKNTDTTEDDKTSVSINDWPQKVYLTFDDGPSANTEKILDILDSYGVKGNFFVVGTENEDLKKMYKRIVDEGHVIGMHSYSHKYSQIYTSVDAFTEDLDKISNLIYEETGVRPQIYRFPGGSNNEVSKVPMEDLIQVLDERGITYYDWNVLSGDATNPMLSKEDIVANVLNAISDNRESMVLFHDLSNKTSTVEALPEIIEAIQEKGIPIVPIDDSTMLIQAQFK